MGNFGTDKGYSDTRVRFMDRPSGKIPDCNFGIQDTQTQGLGAWTHHPVRSSGKILDGLGNFGTWDTQDAGARCLNRPSGKIPNGHGYRDTVRAQNFTVINVRQKSVLEKYSRGLQ